ncbi:hypothetical protein PR202_ga30519 [Eleusine coracana subsp. coracana]|uniref:Transposase (putative) gypsy type domain-containing protein n=1 Tax=Eleusine coracana subsp. coracana TaxID=191504 RepID=A0AAV5DP15_ELECO|nr:hypothetical protein PR202_ga30485 [Eleusine coracana subsp. coracana]GJN12257.1 hypothetical protein PR202_ga30519 [Eleusine coracana subsp. coracana]
MARVMQTARPDDAATEENLPSTVVDTTTSEGDSEAEFAKSLEDNLTAAPEGLSVAHGQEPSREVEDNEEEDNEEEDEEEEDDEEGGGDRDFAPRGVGKVAIDTQGQGSSHRVRSSGPVDKDLEDVDVDISVLLPTDDSDLPKGQKGKGKDHEGSRPRTFIFGHSHLDAPKLYRLAELGCFPSRGARLAGQEVTPCPAEDEAMVFEDHFTVGLRFPCSAFVKDVLSRFNMQLHHISPSGMAMLSKFAWGVLSYQG